MQFQQYASLTSDPLIFKPYTLLNFGASWCHLCHWVQPVLNRLSQEWPETIAIASIDVDTQWDIARQYNIRTLPTLLLLRYDGQEIERLSNFHNREDLLYRCELLMQSHLQHA
ncbi:thioredoxin family protein [Synechococcus sp. PCC 7336]|uniref:thioredoxin family protein n=1 Tax=Synechococcus sp. PCC 7336 TaxID=195250 RepID=UPI00034C2D2C|nr:thioredoxin family protein [Synechococcus sp. PCC 7336]